MAVHYRCAYVPSGNGIAERAHRTVKRIAARLGCSIREAVYWHNVSPKDSSCDESSAPANQFYNYIVCVLGLDAVPEESTSVVAPYA